MSELRERGWMMLPVRYPDPLGTLEWFKSAPSHSGANYDEGGRPAGPGDQFTCYHPHTVLMAGALDVFNDDLVLDIVKEWLGREPVLYSVNAWWSHVAETPSKPNVQYFHRDTDDRRFLALFTYLTDVSDGDGAQQIVEGSHDLPFPYTMGEAFSDYCEKNYKPTTIIGPPGTMFITNPRSIHRGLVPKKRPRLMMWARYGYGSNSNSIDRFCRPLPASLIGAVPTPRLRHVNQLIVDYKA